MLCRTPQFFNLFGAGTAAAVSTRHIPARITEALRLHGLSRPVCGLDDPRLECPELLLLHGFQWQQHDLGSCYQAQFEPAYSQSIIFLNDGGLRIISQAGKQVHDLTRTLRGEIQAHNTVSGGLPAIDVLL